MFPSSGINLWMNNSISFRGNHVLSLPRKSHTYTCVYIYIFSPTFHIPTRLRTSPCTLARICATNDVQESREARVEAATGAVNYRHTIDIALPALLPTRFPSLSLFPPHFFVNLFSHKPLPGKKRNARWDSQGFFEAYEYCRRELMRRYEY